MAALTLQQMLDIALRYATAMSDAMILACYAKSHELGVALTLAPRNRPEETIDWERMVRTNADTARNHC